MNRILAVLVLITLLTACRRGIDQPEITIAELRRHVEYLASDELSGRFPGTGGDEKSASYIRRLFRGYRLSLPADDGLQTFGVIHSSVPGPLNGFSVRGFDYIPGTDFLPMEYSDNDTVESMVSFAGYGFDFRFADLARNDYTGLDVTGKWVLMLSGAPSYLDNRAEVTGMAEDLHKSILARQKGAAGVLLVGSRDSRLQPSGLTQRSAGLPVVYISPALCDSILQPSGKTLDHLAEIMEKTKSSAGFDISSAVRVVTDIRHETGWTHNVVGILEGSDPILKEEYLVVGAHYDHLGMGGKGSSSRKQDTVAVHYGADDNASGTAALLELAELFASRNGMLKRSIIFVAFGAEEMGLLGSKHFISDPPVPLSSIKAMINLDMIGRLNDEQALQVGGTGTSAEGDSLVKQLASGYSFVLATTAEGYGPSDHASFYGQDIPVFFFSTGPHLEYHTPEDHPGLINYPGMKEVSSLVADLIYSLDRAPAALTFTEAGPKSPTGFSRRRNGVTLGIMPDFAGVVRNGLRADFVIKGRPAALGGMNDGDIIVDINGMVIRNIDDYMFALSNLKAGQTIHVEVIRNESRKVLLIQL